MSKSVLILQENQSELDYAATELERAGYKVVTVPSLWVAVAWLRVNDPVLIVAPVHLVDDDVFDLLRFVRSDFHLKQTKILLYCSMPSPFTSGMSRTISSAAKAMGASAVLIGENGKIFDRVLFWQTVSPLLPGPAAPRSFFSISEQADSAADRFFAQEQTFPPNE